MLWFNSEEKKKRMEFIQAFVPTSKAQLLQVAMWYHKGDVKKAQEMVDFYLNNITLPDNDPVPPTWVDQAKSIFGWVKDNQNELVQGYEFIRSVIQNKGALPMIQDTAATPLPNINE